MSKDWFTSIIDKDERMRAIPSDREPSEARRSDEAAGFVATFIIDRSAIFRAGLTHALSGTRFRVLAHDASLDAGLLENIETLAHDQVLLLIGLDEDNAHIGSDIPRLRSSNPKIRVVLLSSRFSSDEGLAALSAGVNGYLAKNELEPRLLLEFLALIVQGTTIVSKAFGDAAAADSSAPRTETAAEAAPPIETTPSRPISLSERELLIVSWLMRGAPNKQIARDLNIAEATVKVHVKSVLRKIGVRNRIQAAIWGMNNFDRQLQSSNKPAERSVPPARPPSTE